MIYDCEWLVGNYHCVIDAVQSTVVAHITPCIVLSRANIAMGLPYNRSCFWTDDCEFFDIIPLSQSIRAVVAWHTIRATFGGALRLGAPDELTHHQKGRAIAAKERWWRPTSEIMLCIYRKTPWVHGDILQGPLSRLVRSSNHSRVTPLAAVDDTLSRANLPTSLRAETRVKSQACFISGTTREKCDLLPNTLYAESTHSMSTVAQSKHAERRRRKALARKSWL